MTIIRIMIIILYSRENDVPRGALHTCRYKEMQQYRQRYKRWRKQLYGLRRTATMRRNMSSNETNTDTSKYANDHTCSDAALQPYMQ